jgi:hypothetical protein
MNSEQPSVGTSSFLEVLATWVCPCLVAGAFVLPQNQGVGADLIEGVVGVLILRRAVKWLLKRFMHGR